MTETWERRGESEVQLTAEEQAAWEETPGGKGERQHTPDEVVR